MDNTTLLLTICLFTCHWLADYTPMSTPEMLKAKATGLPSGPIWLHSIAHGILQALVVLLFTGCGFLYVVAWGIQTFTHFLIDTLKGRMNVWFPSVKDTTKYFHWVIFGLDQLLHAIVILIIVKIVTNG